ncbi:DUF2637 domain-containing protein [Streptomyces sp. OF8]|uniref:DUF2637 domain-containing protein n=1 Tax=Streptomyces alkaliterrae TaxID=2213162 RepID=A0A7W3WS44_9ACTN|nr:DUF2637 domain-containing protein [Streptomyces alkaliterrae]
MIRESLDLLLTWLRIGFPLLRQTAWLLTAATIAFNGAAAWPDPLGVGMHAVIPVLFVVSVEAARHAVGRIADITADRHMEGVRLSRWLLAFPSTFRLWRRMKLWELRSYDEVIRLERDRLVYQARLRARYGRGWRRKAPVEALMPLKLAKYGVPLAETGAEGLAAAGITVPGTAVAPVGNGAAALPARADGPPAAELTTPLPAARATEGTVAPTPAPSGPAPAPNAAPENAAPPNEPPRNEPPPVEADLPAPRPATVSPSPAAAPHITDREPEPAVTVPVGPGRVRALGQAPESEQHIRAGAATAVVDAVAPEADPVGIPDGVPREEVYFAAYRRFIAERGNRPSAPQLSRALQKWHGVTDRDGSPLDDAYLHSYLRELRDRYNAEMGVSG